MNIAILKYFDILTLLYEKRKMREVDTWIGAGSIRLVTKLTYIIKQRIKKN